jgi:sugar lactone lactonase YvrE
MLGAAVPRRREPGFAVAVAEGFGFVVDGELEVVDPVLPEPEHRMNDAKCDSSGRLWAGSTHMDFEPGQGALHRWTGAGPSRVVATGFTLPNGLGWNAEDTTMYLVDTMNHQLLSAPFHPAEGDVGTFSELCRIEPGLPDGLAVDVDGCIWVAVWGGGEVRRYSPSGDLIGRVPMPVDQPSSCAFGDDGTLYITTASSGLSAEQLQHQPLAGSVFALPTSTHGVPVQPFAG